MPEVNHIHVSHVSSPRYAFSGGYICSCMLSAGLTLTVKSLTDHLAFRMSATRFASLRQKWIHPEFQQGNKRLTLREMAEPNVDPEEGKAIIERLVREQKHMFDSQLLFAL